MFSFLKPKKNILELGILSGMTDVHCHLLPGVDDGVRDWEEAQSTVAWLESIGVKRMFLTPHVMEELDNHAASLQCRFKEWQERIHSSIEFHLAAEYMLDTAFIRHRKEGLLTYNGQQVLVETSYFAPPMDLEDLLYDLQTDGYQPVLAHAERYMYMESEQYERLRNCGIRFQLNLMSLSGTYGRLPYEKAFRLLEEGAYTYVGSDFHRLDVYEPSLRRLYLKKKQQDALLRLLENNAQLWRESQTKMQTDACLHP